jgi:hypothetical protein
MFFEHEQVISLEEQKEINDQIDHRLLLSKFKEEMRKNNLKQMIDMWSGRPVCLQYLKDGTQYQVAIKVGGLINKIPDKIDIDYIVDTMSVYYGHIRQYYPNDAFYFRDENWMHTGKTKSFPKKITELRALRGFILYHVREYFDKKNINCESLDGRWSDMYNAFYVTFGSQKIPRFSPEEFRKFLFTLNNHSNPIFYRKLWRHCCCHFAFQYPM